MAPGNVVGGFKSSLRHQVAWLSCGRNVVSVKPHQYRIGRGAVLWRANLAARSLKGKDLAGAYLTWAYLDDADLSHVNLSGAYLTGATLTRTNLKNANLSNADLSGANLWGADLAGADLSRTNFGGSFGDENTRWPEGFDPEDAGVIIK